MGESEEERGARRCAEDWAVQRAGEPHVEHRDYRDDFVPLGPMGFYARISPENEAWVHGYTARLQALVREHGTPAWAPGARLPSKDQLRELLLRARPLGHLAYASKKERWHVRAVARELAPLDRMDSDVLAVRDEARHLVAVFGPEKSSRRIAVVVDTLFLCRMVAKAPLSIPR